MLFIHILRFRLLVFYLQILSLLLVYRLPAPLFFVGLAPGVAARRAFLLAYVIRMPAAPTAAYVCYLLVFA